MVNTTVLKFPKHLLDWIDANRAERSRQSFIIQILFKEKELDDELDNKNSICKDTSCNNECYKD